MRQNQLWSGFPSICNPQIYPGSLKASLHPRSIIPLVLRLMIFIRVLQGKRDRGLIEGLLLPHPIFLHFFSNLLHSLEEISFFFHIPVSPTHSLKKEQLLKAESHVPTPSFKSSFFCQSSLKRRAGNQLSPDQTQSKHFPIGI